MKAFLFLSTVALVVGGIRTHAQRHETFAENPAKRQEMAQAARERYRRDLEEARKWAAEQGMPMRIETPHGVRELIAVRDGRPVYYETRNADAAISTSDTNDVHHVVACGPTGACGQVRGSHRPTVADRQPVH